MKKMTLPLIVILSCLGLCIIGALISVILNPPRLVAQSSRPPVVIDIPTPEPSSLGKRSIMEIVFMKIGFKDWQSIDNYRMSDLPSGKARIILYNLPVTKATAVIAYDTPDAGAIIHRFASVTGGDDDTMAWIVDHLQGGGEGNVGDRHIVVTDDVEAGQVIIEITPAQ